MSLEDLETAAVEYCGWSCAWDAMADAVYRAEQSRGRWRDRGAERSVRNQERRAAAVASRRCRWCGVAIESWSKTGRMPAYCSRECRASAKRKADRERVNAKRV